MLVVKRTKESPRAPSSLLSVTLVPEIMASSPGLPDHQA